MGDGAICRAGDGMTAPERPVSEHELQAYVDERLWPERQLEVEHILRTQPELSRRVAAYRAQRAALRSARERHAAEASVLVHDADQGFGRRGAGSILDYPGDKRVVLRQQGRDDGQTQ